MDSMLLTYSYASAEVTPAATPTDLVVLTGSASRIIRLALLEVTIEATSASVLDLYIYKRSAANTGGTKTNPTPVKHDSKDPAASAIVSLYSANASALGAGELIRSNHYPLAKAAGSNYTGDTWVESFINNHSKPLILRSASESLALNFAGQSLPAGCNVHVTMKWTEEDL